MSRLVYTVFRPAYALHEFSHYLAAWSLDVPATFGVEADGRPYVELDEPLEDHDPRGVLVGLAPVWIGVLYLVTYMWLYLGPLSGLSGLAGAFVHVYLLGSGVVWASPSPEDLAPLRAYAAARRRDGVELADGEVADD